MINDQILWELQASQRLAEFSIEVNDPSDVTGRLVSISEDLILIHIFSHEFAGFNGYSIISREDINLVRWGERRLRLWEKQLVQLPLLDTEVEPIVDLDSWEKAIERLSDTHLMTLYRSDAEPGNNILVGKVLDIYTDSLFMELVDSGGQRDGFVAITLDEISRIDFASSYERNLEKLSGFHADTDSK
ncbi:MAG: hypothetical protein SGJ04_01045 [Bacteroidota bacterium]|nr:hypothetical protein [Bacteroidota bacterium]